MAIGKRNGGGEILPRLKFDARFGTIYLQTRVLENGEWQGEQRNIDISEFCAIFDLPTLETVWALFESGKAPDIVAVPAGEPLPDAPSEKHKQGVRFRCKVSDVLGGGVYECIGLSVGFWHAVDRLHDAYLSEAPQHPGELPIAGRASLRWPILMVAPARRGAHAILQRP